MPAMRLVAEIFVLVISCLAVPGARSAGKRNWVEVARALRRTGHRCASRVWPSVLDGAAGPVGRNRLLPRQDHQHNRRIRARGAVSIQLRVLVAQHIGRHIPGRLTVIVVNMPGGGGLVAANHAFSAAPKDGTVVGLFHEAQMMNQLTGSEGVNFDLRQFNWLGSSYDDPNVCIVRTDAGGDLIQGDDRERSIIAVGHRPRIEYVDAPLCLRRHRRQPEGSGRVSDD